MNKIPQWLELKRLREQSARLHDDEKIKKAARKMTDDIIDTPTYGNDDPRITLEKIVFEGIAELVKGFRNAS